MLDQDPLSLLPSLAGWKPVINLAEATGLAALPAHAHEILLFGIFYFSLYAASPTIGRWISPQYDELSPKVRHGFDSHIVSSVNAVLMCSLSLPLFYSRSLTNLGSYTPYAGMVVAHIIGYFLWDLYITLRYFKYNGIGYLFHAVTALYVFCEGMRPFMLNVAAPFIWFEASTPFVNINWFGTYVPGLVSPTVRTVNGLVLLVVFFIFRIVSGPYNGYFFFREIVYDLPKNVPYMTVMGVFVSYVVLVGLNFVWFWKMLKIAKKMLRGTKKREQ